MATFQRERALESMAHSTYDLVVIGAGMTGAGVALDAASRGLRVALIDGGDIASGTSSKSSKMVHGGLRYLQQREFRLVYENLRERQRLLENAPFLVRPLPFLVPCLLYTSAQYCKSRRKVVLSERYAERMERKLKPNLDERFTLLGNDPEEVVQALVDSDADEELDRAEAEGISE